MEMTSSIEPVSLSDILDLASWNRPRSTEELRDFVNTRASRLALSADIQ